MQKLQSSKGDEENFRFILKETFDEFLKTWNISDSNGDEYFNRKEASRFLGVSEPTFDKIKREGLIRETRIGSITRYRKSDLLNIGREDNTKC